MWFADKKTLYLPSKYKYNTRIHDLIYSATRAAGGCTSVESRGSWVNDDGRMIIEPITLLTWWVQPTAMNTVWRSIEEIIRLLLSEHGEQAVMLEYITWDGKPVASCITLDEEGTLSW